jgi:hypothetical protein
MSMRDVGILDGAICWRFGATKEAKTARLWSRVT